MYKTCTIVLVFFLFLNCKINILKLLNQPIIVQGTLVRSFQLINLIFFIVNVPKHQKIKPTGNPV